MQKSTTIGLLLYTSLVSIASFNTSCQSPTQKYTSHPVYSHQVQRRKQQPQPSPKKKYCIPIVTYTLIAITTITSISCFGTPSLVEKYAVNPKLVYNAPTAWYQCITAGFLHGGWLHLLFNMHSLSIHGEVVEKAYIHRWGYYKGSFLYLLLYLGGIVSGSTAHVFTYKDTNNIRLGASEGVFSLATTDVLLNPTQKVQGLPRWLFELLYTLGSSYLMDTMTGEKIGHTAHLAGALFGMVYTLIFNPSLLLRFYNYLSRSKPKQLPIHPNRVRRQKMYNPVFY